VSVLFRRNEHTSTGNDRPTNEIKGVRVKSLRFGVEGLVRVEGVGLRVEGKGFRV
jgi:hypothetical protein